MSDVSIIAAEGWKEGAPSSEMPLLLSEESGRLCLLDSNLSMQHDFGSVGPVDCPIAYDATRRLAFRYVCEASFQYEDFSQLRAFSIDRRESFSVKDLPINQWALWFLEWIAASGSELGQLLGLLATDRTNEDQIVIEHRLFTCRPGDDLLRLRPLPYDAYKPLAFSQRRRELVFAGADGIHLLSLRGERKLSLPKDASTSGQGAAFAPDGSGRVIVGGDGLHLWDFEQNTCARLTRNGRYPVWTPDGEGVWYRESSGDLFYYDMSKDEVREVLSLDNQKHPEFWYARPVSLSGSGRFLATSLTRKVLRGVSRKGSATGRPEREYLYERQICVLDLEKRTYWGREGFANQLRWVE
ncbi:hypothetical protein N9Q19_01035 [Puniceicoccaceae bacterium]|nr:hypothetical protein [Puniceicoccaceae bacterium]